MKETNEQIDKSAEDMKTAVVAVEKALKGMGPAMCIIVLADRHKLPSVGHTMCNKDVPMDDWVPMTVMIGAVQAMLVKMTKVGVEVMGDECLRQIMAVADAEPIERTLHFDG